MDKVFDVVALGEGMVEFNQTQAGEPVYLQGFGGDTSNAVIAAARAGARCAYLSRVGEDRFGKALLSLWQAEGVDTSAVDSDAGAPTGIYFVTHGASGHEFSYLRAGSAASRMDIGWLRSHAAPVIRQARVLHLSGITLAISSSACEAGLAAMQLARDAGTLVAFDSNLRLKLWPLAHAKEAITRAVGRCGIFLPSAEDMLALTGLSDPDAVVDWAHTQGAPQVVLKLGADGALVSDGSQREQIPGIASKVVDATGAGDCFCGNLLARMAAGDDLLQAARYANAAAALSVRGWGAVAPLPSPAAVRALQ